MKHMNGLSKDVNRLKHYFCEQSLLSLQSVFDKSSISTYETVTLNERLLSILLLEESRNISRLIRRKTSPDGKNHIVICNDLCFLVNIHGFLILMSNWLFYDGELDIINIQWIDKDNLVLFDAYYIVHDKMQKGVCHYSNEDSFVFFSEIRKGVRSAQTMSLFQKNPWEEKEGLLKPASVDECNVEL